MGTVLGGDGEDYIQITKKGQGNLLVDAGADNDVIFVDYLDGNGTVWGGTGDDLLLLDARGGNSSHPMNTMDMSHLNWDGGEGSDTVDMHFVSSGTTNLNVFGDAGSDRIIARCSNETCSVLSQSTVMANIHNTESSHSSLERINMEPGSSIESLFLYLNEESENSVYFDDTISTTFVFGGNENDSFHIGQIYYVSVVLQHEQ